MRKGIKKEIGAVVKDNLRKGDFIRRLELEKN